MENGFSPHILLFPSYFKEEEIWRTAVLISPREVVLRRLGLESQLVTPRAMVAGVLETRCLSPDTFPSPDYDQHFLLKTVFL